MPLDNVLLILKRGPPRTAADPCSQLNRARSPRLQDNENLYVSGGMFAYTYPNLFTGLAGGRTLTWSYLIAKQTAAL